MRQIIYNGKVYSGLGGASDHVYLTQAEYDALPDSKLTDNKIYLVDDGSEAEEQRYTEAAENIFYRGGEGQPDNVQDAIQEIMDESKIITYSNDADAFTFVDSAVYKTSVIFKSGHIVSIHLSAALAEFTQGVETSIGTILNPGLRPKITVRIPTFSVSGTGVAGLGCVVISSEGPVSYIPITGDGLNWLYFDGIYMTN